MRKCRKVPAGSRYWTKQQSIKGNSLSSIMVQTQVFWLSNVLINQRFSNYSEVQFSKKYDKIKQYSR